MTSPMPHRQKHWRSCSIPLDGYSAGRGRQTYRKGMGWETNLELFWRHHLEFLGCLPKSSFHSFSIATLYFGPSKIFHNVICPCAIGKFLRLFQCNCFEFSSFPSFFLLRGKLCPRFLCLLRFRFRFAGSLGLSLQWLRFLFSLFLAGVCLGA